MKESYEMIVFLGNPGKQYEKTRHNAAWRLSDRLDLNWQQKFNGLWCKGDNLGRSLIFLKPQTMMNLSGNSLRSAMDFFKMKPEQILVVHDELEKPFGEVILQRGGGLAGHNGLKSIKQQLGTAEFGRLRLGIGRPPFGDVSRWVLSPFAPSEEAELDSMLMRAQEKLQAAFS